ncbi:hypothetical protein AAFF_G00438900 [Aldrovandia affinis]|uniref:Uncharacterized protein n=1 Tax=Aldrovandia affinis TaxID=143900 RepID=A0AAD7S9P8_9TELE|nr:hypothetical protein AAFF_G00438900 [Aldrovandia affinis]
MEKKVCYLGLEEEEKEEQDEQRKQEKGGKFIGIFRRSPKPAEHTLPLQENQSTHELSASNDSLSDSNTKEKGGMFGGMFRKSPKCPGGHTPEQDILSTHSELSASNDSLSDTNTKEKGGMFGGMFRKSPKRPGGPTLEQDNLSTHSELTASNDSLSDNNTKEKGGMFTGMFRRSPKPAECTIPVQENESPYNELSASNDSLSDNNTKEKGGMFSGKFRKSPKPGDPIPAQDSLSLYSDLSLSCESLSETSSKHGIMGKILRNPFRAVSQDRDKSDPGSEAGENSSPAVPHSKPKQNGVKNGILKNPFCSTAQKEQDSDCEEKATNDPQPKHKHSGVVGAMSKVNPFRSASKEISVREGSATETEYMQDPEQEKQPEQDSEHKPDEDHPIYENVLLKSQDKHSEEVEAKKDAKDRPKIRVQKKGKKARNPFLPANGAKSNTLMGSKSEKLPVDTSHNKQEPAEDSKRGKSLYSQLEEYRTSGMEPETAGEGEEEEEENNEGLMEWWDTVEQWDDLPQDEDLTEKEEAKAFAVTADKVHKGIRVFNKLFTERAEGLWQHVIDLNTIADGIDRFNKKAKIASITGGSTSAVGGVATIVGLALAPVTMGTSLIITAVGLGVATAGGLTSASASISNTVNNSLDRKKVEKIVEDYQSKIADISKCMKFIKQGIENLRKYDVVKMKNHAYNQDFPVLTNIYEDGAMAGKAILINTGEIMRVVQIANVAGSTAARAVQVASLATGVLTGLFVGMDIYFVAKDSCELKKGAKTEFAAKIREVAEQLHEGLVELNSIREELQEASSNI